MAELIEEVLALHKTLHTDRSQTDTLTAERDRLIQCQDTVNKRCKQLEEEADRLHKILATRNGELSQELGLQPSYNKCLAELAEVNSKLEQLSMKTEQEVNEIHLKLRHSQASQAHLESRLSVEKLAHAATSASLQQTQQKNIREVQELEAKYEAASQAIQVKLDKALLEQQKLQQLLEKERSAFRASMITQSDDRKDATWKSKLMKLRTELEHTKQERDRFKRQCIR